MNKKLKGSFTIEASFIVPIIMMIFITIVLTIFYYHDKNILNAAVYETAVVASIRFRDEKEMSEDIIEELLLERIGNKCIFLSYENNEIIVEKEVICIKATASKGKFKVRASAQAATVKAEEKIRERSRWKDILP
ncbi:MAG: TadE/TadG family type IV pilus assembly protein [Suipraeoptans sp.]